MLKEVLLHNLEEFYEKFVLNISLPPRTANHSSVILMSFLFLRSNKPISNIAVLAIFPSGESSLGKT